MYLVKNPYKIMYAFSRMWNSVEGLIKSVSRFYYGNLHRLRDDAEELDFNETQISRVKENLTNDVMLSLLSSKTVPNDWFEKFEKLEGKETALQLVEIVAENMKNNKFKFVVENYVDLYYSFLKNDSDKLDYTKLINLTKRFQRGGVNFKPLNEHVNSFVAHRKKPCPIVTIRQSIYELVATHIYLVEMNMSLKNGVPLHPQTN